MIYTHLNRLIQDTDADVTLVVGPGHVAPAVLANLYLEGTLREYYPALGLDEAGAHRLARQFGWPDGVPDRLTPETPGMIHAGGEPGSSLARAFGAAFDNPGLIVPCIIDDSETETGALAAAWQSNKYLDPARDGAVLPILLIGGYRASGPSLYGRMDNDDLDNLFTGYGYEMGIVSGDEPEGTHEAMWQAMDWAYDEIRELQSQARSGDVPERPVWPMLIVRTPCGWTCPREVDGLPVEDTFRAQGLPVPDPRNNPEHMAALETWLRGYQPENLFDEAGCPRPEILAVCPKGDRRIGRSRHANGGELRTDLVLPEPAACSVRVTGPGEKAAGPTGQLGAYLRDLIRANGSGRNFRLFCPDEVVTHRMEAVFDATDRVWLWPVTEADEHLAPDGRILEILSPLTCQAWLEGYLQTGRHGMLVCGEGRLPAVEAMLNRYGAWLSGSRQTPWRKPTASLNCLLTSKDWAGESAGGRGMSAAMQDVAVRGGSVRLYLPPDGNCLLWVADRCLRSYGQVNLVVSSLADMPQWLDSETARQHTARGASVWPWASNGLDDPDVVLAAAGDVVTGEALAAVSLLRREMPDLRVRVTNVVDLLTLLPRKEDPYGLDDEEFAALFGTDCPVVFAFHGHPSLVHELVRTRPGAARFDVHGYVGQDRTTTPFDMLVINRVSRFHLAIAALERVGRLRDQAGPVIERLRGRLALHEQYIHEHNEDLPEITEWRWAQGED
jgi:xylulose-5-phosphate/fructose-6-phosphate phosphoketolase